MSEDIESFEPDGHGGFDRVFVPAPKPRRCECTDCRGIYGQSCRFPGTERVYLPDPAYLCPGCVEECLNPQD